MKNVRTTPGTIHRNRMPQLHPALRLPRHIKLTRSSRVSCEPRRQINFDRVTTVSRANGSSWGEPAADFTTVGPFAARDEFLMLDDSNARILAAMVSTSPIDVDAAWALGVEGAEGIAGTCLALLLLAIELVTA